MLIIAFCRYSSPDFILVPIITLSDVALIINSSVSDVGLITLKVLLKNASSPVIVPVVILAASKLMIETSEASITPAVILSADISLIFALVICASPIIALVIQPCWIFALSSLANNIFASFTVIELACKLVIFASTAFN